TTRNHGHGEEVGHLNRVVPRRHTGEDTPADRCRTAPTYVNVMTGGRGKSTIVERGRCPVDIYLRVAVHSVVRAKQRPTIVEVHIGEGGRAGPGTEINTLPRTRRRANI